MTRYKIISSGTELKAWPYKIYVEHNNSPVPPPLQDIYYWLNKNEIKYQYCSGFYWYFKDEQDVVAFKLKWS